MLPLIAMAAASAAAGAYGANQARKSSQEAMRQAEAQQDAAYEILLRTNPAALEGLVNVAPDALMYNPEEYNYIEGGSPILYGLPEEMQAALVADSPEARAMQMNSLANLQERSDEGLSAKDQADFLRGRRRAGEMSRGREGAIINNMQARGMSGSGIEAAMRMMASQEGASRLSESQADEAAANAMVREQALRDLLAGSTNVRGQDIALNSTNANILNDFARENSRRRMEINNARVDQQNRFNENEINEQRNISGMNTGVRNDAQYKNNAMLMNNQRDRSVSANNNLTAQTNAKNQYLQSLAGAKLGALPGIYAQGAADANYQQAMYGNVGNAIGTIGQAYAADSRRDQDYQRQKDFRDQDYQRQNEFFEKYYQPKPKS